MVTNQPIAAPQYVMANPYQAPAQMAVVSGQSVPAGRARPGLTIDFFRLPIPYPRLVAIPTAPEMAMVPMAAPQVFAVQPQAVTPVAPMMQQALAAQPQELVAAPPQAAPQLYAVQPQAVTPVAPMMQQAFVAQPQALVAAPPQPTVYQPQAVVAAPQAAAPVPTQAVVPVQGHAVIPVQGQAVVPVQGQAVVPVQGQSLSPIQAPAYAAPQVTAQLLTPPPPVPQAAFSLSPQALKTLSPEEVEKFCRQVQALQKAMESQGK
jgi:hypothetical protein